MVAAIRTPGAQARISPRSSRTPGPSRQTNAPPNWQWPQRPTAHCMLRSMLRNRRDWGSAALQQGFRRDPHHAFRAAHHRHGARRIEAGQAEQFRHVADMPGPQCRALARRHQHLGIRQLGPAVVLLAPDQVFGVLHALDDDQLAVAFAPFQDVMNDRHHRRAAQSAGHQHDVVAAHFLQRPAAAERPAQPHLVAGLQRGQSLGDAPERPNGVADAARGRPGRT